ncbi:MAG: type II toxin-antitoxin system VapC family toxin [Pyrinomonadaceae bacterium]
MPDFLIDTDVLIDISRGNSDAADFVDSLNGEIFIGRISAMRLMVGARDRRDQLVIEKFIKFFEIQELSDGIGREAYQALKQYSRSHGLMLADALIAATAKEKDLELVSKNAKHFRPIKGLKFLKAVY